jgi:hypothetical protein
MTDPSDLPPAKRLLRYRQLADDARREADRSKGTVKQSYLLIAEQWERLAAELAKESGFDPD